MKVFKQFPLYSLLILTFLISIRLIFKDTVVIVNLLLIINSILLIIYFFKHILRCKIKSIVHLRFNYHFKIFGMVGILLGIYGLKDFLVGSLSYIFFNLIFIFLIS